MLTLLTSLQNTNEAIVRLDNVTIFDEFLYPKFSICWYGEIISSLLKKKFYWSIVAL